jgi:hypothetical protein
MVLPEPRAGESTVVSGYGHYTTTHDEYEGDTICAEDEEEWPCQHERDALGGAALRRLREALERAGRDALFLLMPEDRDFARWCIEYPFAAGRGSGWSRNYYGVSIAEAADKCREALG